MRVAQSRGVRGLDAAAPFSPELAAEAGLTLVLPIGDQGKPMGLLALAPPRRGALDENETEFLQALLGLAASSIENALSHRQVVETNRALDQKIQEMRTMFDLGRGLASTIDIDELTRILLLTLSGRYAVRKHALFTWKPGQPPIRRIKGFEDLDAAALEADARQMESAKVRDGLMLIPIRAAAETHGLVVLGPRALGRPYTEADLDFAQGLIAYAAMAFENAWHFRDTLPGNRSSRSCRWPRRSRRASSPSACPRSAPPTWRRATARPARWAAITTTCCPSAPCLRQHCLCVADICGKGLPAALLMANIQATLRATSAPKSATRRWPRASVLLYASTPATSTPPPFS